MNTSKMRRACVAPALLALGLAACGSDASDATTDDTTASTDAPVATDDTPVSTDTDMDDMDHSDDMDMDDMDMDDMDHSAMNMGDPDATPADDVVGASLARGEYVLMDTRPQGYDDVAGTAVIARSPSGTTITTELTGLKPNVEYISHAHAQACDDDDAGPHYQFEVGGSEFPPNEIHLAFTSDNDGNGFMTAENAQIAGADAVAFVVHPMEFIDNKIACVDFVEDEPGSIDAAIAAGLDESAAHDHDDHDADADHDADDHADEDADADDHTDHDDHDDHADHGDVEGDLGDLDVSALHAVDVELSDGTMDAPAQLAVVDAGLDALEAVGPNEGNAELVAALTELKAALAAGDLSAAAAAATTAHDAAHALEHDHG